MRTGMRGQASPTVREHDCDLNGATRAISRHYMKSVYLF